MLKSSLRRVLFVWNSPLATLWKEFSKSSLWKEKSEDHKKGYATERAWTENPSLKNPESIPLSYLQLDESRWKENTKIRTSAQRQPSSGALAADLAVLLFADGSLSFVF